MESLSKDEIAVICFQSFLYFFSLASAAYFLLIEPDEFTSLAFLSSAALVAVTFCIDMHFKTKRGTVALDLTQNVF